MSRPLKETLASLDQLIRQGQSRQVKAEILGIRLDRVARADKSAVANLARRCGIPELAVKILNPILRNETRALDSTPLEWAEYAMSLAKIGATSEALAILRGLPAAELPEALLFQAFALISRWDYPAAIPLLRSYVELPEGRIETYQRWTAQVNLAACLIFIENWEEGGRILDEVRARTLAANAMLLHGNCQELSAQLLIHRGDFAEAARSLAEAARAMKEVGSFDELFVRKWEAVLESRRRALPEAKVLELLSEVRGLALQRRHWETVRDCDFHRAVFTRDAELFAQVYHGTPFPSYRARLKTAFENTPAVPPFLVWVPDGSAHSGGTFDLESAEDPASGRKIPADQLPHSLLRALATDFYRPARTAELFSRLFPEEHFNPRTSVARVHQTLLRLREGLSSAGIPLRVSEESGFYSLGSEPGYGIRTLLRETAEQPLSAVELRLERLRRKLAASATFTTEVVSTNLALDKRTAQRLITDAIRLGKVEKLRDGRSILYRFKAS